MAWTEPLRTPTWSRRWQTVTERKPSLASRLRLRRLAQPRRRTPPGKASTPTTPLWQSRKFRTMSSTTASMFPPYGPSPTVIEWRRRSGESRLGMGRTQPGDDRRVDGRACDLGTGPRRAGLRHFDPTRLSGLEDTQGG